jgi:hypothetical protein
MVTVVVIADPTSLSSETRPGFWPEAQAILMNILINIWSVYRVTYLRWWW